MDERERTEKEERRKRVEEIRQRMRGAQTLRPNKRESLRKIPGSAVELNSTRNDRNGSVSHQRPQSGRYASPRLGGTTATPLSKDLGLLFGRSNGAAAPSVSNDASKENGSPRKENPDTLPVAAEKPAAETSSPKKTTKLPSGDFTSILDDMLDKAQTVLEETSTDNTTPRGESGRSATLAGAKLPSPRAIRANTQVVQNGRAADKPAAVTPDSNSNNKPPPAQPEKRVEAPLDNPPSDDTTPRSQVQFPLAQGEEEEPKSRDGGGA